MRKWIKGSIAHTILLNATTVFAAGFMALVASPWFWVAGIAVTAGMWIYRWWVIRTDSASDKTEAEDETDLQSHHPK